MHNGLCRNVNKAFFGRWVYSGPSSQGSLKFSNFKSSVG